MLYAYFCWWAWINFNKNVYYRFDLIRFFGEAAKPVSPLRPTLATFYVNDFVESVLNEKFFYSCV